MSTLPRIIFIAGTAIISIFPALAADVADAKKAPPTPPGGQAIELPTGASITPLAAPRSVYQNLKPGLKGAAKNYLAGQAVTSALSPDKTTMLVLTSGYNSLNDFRGQVAAADSNEYVFVYDVTGSTPVPVQVIEVPNTFMGLVWNPSGKEFYVSGGVNDKVHIFGPSATGWVLTASVSLGHSLGNGLLSNAPAPLNAAAPPPMVSGIAVNQSGTFLIAANLFNDSASLIDLTARTKVAELDLRPGASDVTKTGIGGGEYPFWVAFKGDNKAYVSSTRDREIVVLNVGTTLTVASRIPVAGQPNKMLMTKAQDKLFIAVDNSDLIAVVDTSADGVSEKIATIAPTSLPLATKLRGANPNGLALSADEKTLYVTNGGTNSVAVITLGAPGGSQVTGLIPTPWYPTSVTLKGNYLYVTNAKSVPGPNPRNCQDPISVTTGDSDPCNAANQYVLQTQHAGLLSLPIPNATDLADLTRQVAKNNHYPMAGVTPVWQQTMSQIHGSIQHVIYIIKENRTYDQILGDLDRGDGDPALAVFPKAVTPNLHSLARNFVTLDRFFDSGEVSGVGWNWSTTGRTTDYAEKAQGVNYAGRGLTYDWEGTNRNVNVGIAGLADRIKADPLLFPGLLFGATQPAPDANLLPGAVDVMAPDSASGEAGTGYLWDQALRAGLTVRNYGMYLDLVRYQGPASVNPLYVPFSMTAFSDGVQQAFPAKASLLDKTDLFYRGFDQQNSDLFNYREWAREFDGYVQNNNLPSLSLVRLAHDHTGSFGTAAYGVNTPTLQVADNDYAVGQLIEHVAGSPFAGNTLICILEDDAQDGPDHVDAHRSIGFIVGPYVKQGAVISARYTTVNMVRTIEEVLGLTPESIHAGSADPMWEVFDVNQATWNYNSLVPPVLRQTSLPLPAATPQNSVALTPREKQFAKLGQKASWWAKKTGDMDFDEEDKLDAKNFNEILWKGIFGNKPYPAVRGAENLRERREELLKKYGLR